MGSDHPRKPRGACDWLVLHRTWGRWGGAPGAPEMGLAAIRFKFGGSVVELLPKTKHAGRPHPELADASCSRVWGSDPGEHLPRLGSTVSAWRVLWGPSLTPGLLVPSPPSAAIEDTPGVWNGGELGQ